MSEAVFLDPQKRSWNGQSFETDVLRNVPGKTSNCVIMSKVLQRRDVETAYFEVIPLIS